MTEYTVAAEFTLKDGVSPILDKIIAQVDKATRLFGDFQEKLDRIGAGGINRLLQSLSKLETARFPSELADGASRFDRALGDADARLTAMARHASELAAAMKDIKVPAMPAGPGGGGGHGGGGHGGDPVMQGIAGGAVLEFLGGNFDKYKAVDQTYRALQSDSNLAGDSPAMRAIRKQAGGQLDRYSVLTPLDVAKNAGEAYGISGGKMGEQSAIADMLDRLEQNLVLRGKDPADAQRQATAVLKAADISNRFFDPKTGQFSLQRANTEIDRMQALIAAGGGFTTGQSILSFEKSAGLAGQQLSLEGEAKLAHFIEVNPSRSGTMLKSFASLFGGHGTRMAKKDKAAWTKAGLYGKNGMLVDDELRKSDVIGWIEKHQSQLTPDMITDRVQRQTVSSFLAETHGSIGNINRQAAAVIRSNPDGNAANLSSSPQGATLRFEASMEKFRTSLGKFEAGPGVKILDSLTKGLDRLTTVMAAHPGASDAILKMTAALAGFAVLRGAASLLGIGEGLGALSKGLSLLGKGSAAGGALEALGAAAGAGSLFGLAGGLAALGAAVFALPPLLKHFFGVDDAHANHTTNAHGGGYTGAKPPAAGDTPQAAMQNWLNSTWNSLTAPPQSRGNSRGLHATPTAYMDGSGSAVHLQPINLTLQLDGRTIAKSTTAHQTAWATRPDSGSGFDPMEHVQRPGTPLAAVNI